MTLVYVVDRSEDTRRVRFSGEIDMGVAAEAVDVITETVLDGRPRRMIIDLGQVSLLDSTGVAALITAHKIAAQRGCALVVANPVDIVRELLTVTGVLDVLTGASSCRDSPPDPQPAS